MSRRLGWLLAACALGASATSAAAQTGRKLPIETGRVFRVIARAGADGDDARAALAAAEAAWEHARLAYGLPDEAPDDHLRIHLYRERAAFDAACETLEGRTWPGHDGLTSPRHRIAVLHIGAGLPAAPARALGLTHTDLALVAHEATHLVGVFGMPGYAGHPAWIGEGIAEWVSARALLDVIGETDADDVPALAMRLAFAQDTLRAGRLPALKELLVGELDGLDAYRRYAVYGAFMDFLRAHYPRATRDLVRSINVLWNAEQVATLLERALHPDKFAAIEDKFHAHLAGGTPGWSLGPGILQQVDDAWMQVARSDAPAHAWRLPAERGPYTLTGQGSSGRGERELLFGRRFARAGASWTDELYALVLAPSGEVRLVQRTSGPDGTRERTLARAQDAPIGAAFSLRVDRALTLRLDGEVVLEARFDDVPTGPWGVGVAAGADARWVGLEVGR